MNIWQWILVLWPVFRMGQSIAKDAKFDNGKLMKDSAGKIMAAVLIAVIVEFIMYKAGVLVIK